MYNKYAIITQISSDCNNFNTCARNHVKEIDKTDIYPFAEAKLSWEHIIYRQHISHV